MSMAVPVSGTAELVVRDGIFEERGDSNYDYSKKGDYKDHDDKHKKGKDVDYKKGKCECPHCADCAVGFPRPKSRHARCSVLKLPCPSDASANLYLLRSR